MGATVPAKGPDVQEIRNLPIETRLTAYIDGEANREEKLAVEELLAKDADVHQVYDRLRHGSDVGRKLFDEILREPVPLALVRSIKSAPPPKIREVRRSRPAMKLAPSGKQALAAALILFVIGGGIGYLFGSQPGAARLTLPVAPSQSHSFPDDIAAAQRIYLRQSSHVVEVGPTRTDDIVTWLTGTVGVRFNVPDLASEGLVFQGARLLVAAGKPTGQLIYRNIDGEMISICFLKDASGSDSGDFNEVIKDDIGIVSWHRDGVGYAIVGASSDALLDDLANRVSVKI
jgi:anti-sigma factor RsiW